MSPNVAVPLYLTILMIILCAIAIVGGRAIDKKKAAGQSEKVRKLMEGFSKNHGCAAKMRDKSFQIPQGMEAKDI